MSTIEKFISEMERKNLSEADLKKYEDEEKKKREALFNERKRKYENNYNEDGERYVLCYTFEDKEKQIEKSSKLLEYTFNLYKFADYVNKFINNSEENSECNESYFDTEKYLDLLSLILMIILKKY